MPPELPVLGRDVPAPGLLPVELVLPAPLLPEPLEPQAHLPPEPPGSLLLQLALRELLAPELLAQQVEQVLEALAPPLVLADLTARSLPPSPAR
ncbi:MAG: hypothetical protein PHS53_00965 [Candidatus Pacebacteria bacterium]|nr:hypothetical protein [Candidatus Paceibacterota bacterium]